MIGFYSSILYLISAVLFILSLHGLSHPETARRGNLFGMVGMGSIFEEMGKTLTPSPLFSTGVLGASLISLGGNNSQKQSLLPKIVDGSLTTALALEEGNRHSPYSINTKAVKDGDNFKISGEKTFVIDGHTAGLLIVAARTDGSIDDSSGISLFLVDPNSKGVEITKTSMVDSRNAASIQFEDAIVSSSEILGEQNNGAGILEEVLDRAQIAISAEMLDTANTYDDKVAVIRMIVGDEAGRVSSVFKNMMEKE